MAHKPLINKNMEYTITMADLCELAHAYTVKNCEAKGIKWERIDENEDEGYTDEAQDIFNGHLDFIETHLVGNN